MNSDEILGLVKSRLSSGIPSEVPGELMASVAITLGGKRPMKTLMIKRVELSGDPWSGQVAFPGGRKEPQDESLLETAIREAREEVGIDLAESARYLGHTGHFRTHTGRMLVVPCVFMMASPGLVRTNAEVASYRWVPFETFFKERTRSVGVPGRGSSREKLPAYVYKDYVIWGLTYRIISALVGREELPTLPR